jgi:GTP-binding protein Era
MGFKAGFVALIGRANAGKSTLVNALVGQKVSIVSSKPQTTRNRVLGMVNRGDAETGAQVVLVDTPGLHHGSGGLSKLMLDEVKQGIEGVDILSLIVDASAEFGTQDREALGWVKRFRGPVFLLLNKVDRVQKQKLLPLIEFYNREHEFAEIFPISALKKVQLEPLLKSWISYLPEHEPYFPTDQFTDQPERFMAAEFIREKAIQHTREEIPHSVAVLVDDFEETEKLLRIRATIYVERDGQKGIVIGKGGAMLKTIGTEARLELEKLLGVKIFLELNVKVQPNWRQRSHLVRQINWRSQMEGMEREEDGAMDVEDLKLKHRENGDVQDGSLDDEDDDDVEDEEGDEEESEEKDAEDRVEEGDDEGIEDL